MADPIASPSGPTWVVTAVLFKPFKKSMTSKVTCLPVVSQFSKWIVTPSTSAPRVVPPRLNQMLAALKQPKS